MISLLQLEARLSSTFPWMRGSPPTLFEEEINVRFSNLNFRTIKDVNALYITIMFMTSKSVNILSRIILSRLFYNAKVVLVSSYITKCSKRYILKSDIYFSSGEVSWRCT